MTVPTCAVRLAAWLLRPGPTIPMNAIVRSLRRRVPVRLAAGLALLVALTAGTPALASAAPAPPVRATVPTTSQPVDGIEPVGTVLLRPGEYLWTPELAPGGPVVLVVSLPEQQLHVYRNGVRIGVSTLSSGKTGHETPTGVFTILEKRREHYSNLYDNAPMPFMQRLTWGGIALHAGHLPGYPASHGCVRLPYEFSQKLYGITTSGMTVVIANEASHAPSVAYPGWFAPVDAATGAPWPGPAADFHWSPERAPSGALTLVLSLADQEVVAMRNGVEIGRSAVLTRPGAWRGTHVYVLLDDASGPLADAAATPRPRRRWMLAASIGGEDPAGLDVDQALGDGGLQVPPAFAADVYAALQPGATVVVTAESIRGRTPAELTVIRADQDPAAPPPADPDGR